MCAKKELLSFGRGLNYLLVYSDDSVGGQYRGTHIGEIVPEIVPNCGCIPYYFSTRSSYRTICSTTLDVCDGFANIVTRSFA